MGEIADDLIERGFDMLGDIDDGHSPFTGRVPNRKSKKPPANFYDNRKRGFKDGKLVPKPGKPKPRRTPEEEKVHAREYPGAHTDPALLPDYDPKLFDMSHFPTMKPRRVPEPNPRPRVLRPADWKELADDEAPF